jgi:hypothetical protein
MVMDTVDLSVSTSQIFAYSAARSGQAIDNIVVSDTVDVLPPPLQLWQQWWFWAAILAVVIMVSVVAFFRLRRK